MELLSGNVLIHICCGICASWPVQCVRDDGYSITGYFYNPNIHPKEEYEKRLNVARNLADIFEFELIIGEYDHDKWLEAVKGYEAEPEGGKRCGICMRYRIEECMKRAKALGSKHFTTTLPVSPHKDSKLIKRMGEETGGDMFLFYDFKKQDGFKKTRDFAKTHEFYCQNYCGCEFSLRK